MSRLRAVERELPDDDAEELIALAARIGDDVLAPAAAAHERDETFPADAFALLGGSGLLGLPYPEEHGGGGQPYAVYLQVVEELAARWASVALGVSVHALACFPIAKFGSDAQKNDLLPGMLNGDRPGAYCLSEAHAGSDPSAMRASARQDPESGQWTAQGEKAWVTHGDCAAFYTVFLRTDSDSRRGITCFHAPAGADGLRPGRPEQKMGLTGSPTTPVLLDRAELPEGSVVGMPGAGLQIAYCALDYGRLGVSAVAVGLARAALERAVDYAREREAFGKPVIEHQGLAFLLADMAAAVESARATYLHAARMADAGRPFSRQASVSKLICTDAAMRVTTDAVQVLGGAGYTRDHPVERYMRESKVMQIFEGTNQIQRMLIGRHLAQGAVG